MTKHTALAKHYSAKQKTKLKVRIYFRRGNVQTYVKTNKTKAKELRVYKFIRLAYTNWLINER